MIGALILGPVAGVLGRALMPGILLFLYERSVASREPGRPAVR